MSLPQQRTNVGNKSLVRPICQPTAQDVSDNPLSVKSYSNAGVGCPGELSFFKMGYPFGFHGNKVTG